MDEVEDKGRIAGILPMECLSMGTHTKAYQSYGKINTPKIQGYNMVGARFIHQCFALRY